MFLLHWSHKIYWNVGVWLREFMTGIQKEWYTPSEVHEVMISAAIASLLLAGFTALLVTGKI